MKHTLYFLLLTLVLVSCGADSRHFRIDGRLLNLNQGEFYVYSPDGAVDGIDTIKVMAGRFSYETECDRPATLFIVFPNYTEQPVFARPGKTVDIKGDASHMKEMKITGTKDNELMSDFRSQVADATPPEAQKAAAQFIDDHADSPVGVYLVRKYFIQVAQPDYAAASRLVAKMMAAQPDNGVLKRLSGDLKKAPAATKGRAVKIAPTRDLDGNVVNTATLTSAATTIVMTCASWNFESMSQLRLAADMAKASGKDIKVIGISIDASPADCRRYAKVQNFKCPVICDGNMVDTPILRSLGLYSIPDNVVLQHGRITDAHLSNDDIRKLVEK